MGVAQCLYMGITPFSLAVSLRLVAAKQKIGEKFRMGVAHQFIFFKYAMYSLQSAIASLPKVLSR